MSTESNLSAPDPRKLGRGSHLRILIVNSNTVCHPPEGPTGTLTQWLGSNGERCEARFQYEELQLEPNVMNGERVEWINTKNYSCTIIFDKYEIPEPPFADGGRQFTVEPGRSVFSGLIKGKVGERYRYLVNFAVPLSDDDSEHRGDPVIIIRE